MTSIKTVLKKCNSLNSRCSELEKEMKELVIERQAADSAVASGTFGKTSPHIDDLFEHQGHLAARASKLALEFDQAKVERVEAEAKKQKSVLEFISRKREELIAEITDALADMSAPIASLITMDIVQARLIGADACDPKLQGDLPVSGRALAAKFLAGIPPELRPANLYSDEIEEYALWFAECVDGLCPDDGA